MKYLLTSRVLERLRKTQEVAVFLDFDGTLVPHTDWPQDIRVPEEVPPLLRKLSQKKGYTVGIISGRSLRDIKSHLIIPPGIPISGSHGMEWEIGGEYKMVDLPEGYTEALVSLQKDISMLLEQVPGASIGWKDISMSVQLRMVPGNRVANVREDVLGAIARANDHRLFSIINGRTDVDVRPNISWTKAEVVRHFFRELGLDMDQTTFMYIGDGVTDEDVFRAFPKSVTVHVGRSTNTRASYYLKHVEDVITTLRKLLSG